MEKKEKLNLYITILANNNIDEIDREDLSLGLANELRELDEIEFAEPLKSEQFVEGAKGIVADLGTIAATIIGGGDFMAVATLLGSWLSYDQNREIKLQIDDKVLEVKGLSKDDQKDLINWFILRANSESERLQHD
jgi:hypothetical protein